MSAANTVISFWTDKVPIAAWITIWWAVLVLVNIGAVTIFGEVEVICSTIKFSWIFVVIISLIGKSRARQRLWRFLGQTYPLWNGR